MLSTNFTNKKGTKGVCIVSAYDHKIQMPKSFTESLFDYIKSIFYKQTSKYQTSPGLYMVLFIPIIPPPHPTPTRSTNPPLLHHLPHSPLSATTMPRIYINIYIFFQFIHL